MTLTRRFSQDRQHEHDKCPDRDAQKSPIRIKLAGEKRRKIVRRRPSRPAGLPMSRAIRVSFPVNGRGTNENMTPSVLPPQNRPVECRYRTS